MMIFKVCKQTISPRPCLIVNCISTPEVSQIFYSGFMHTVDNKGQPLFWKVMDYINTWFCNWVNCSLGKQYQHWTVFFSPAGLDYDRNVTVLVNSIANASQLLPSVLFGTCPRGPSCDVVPFFVPWLVCLLQNLSIMIPENVVLDFEDPLKPYKVGMVAFSVEHFLGVFTRKPIHV